MIEQMNNCIYCGGHSFTYVAGGKVVCSKCGNEITEEQYDLIDEAIDKEMEG